MQRLSSENHQSPFNPRYSLVQYRSLHHDAEEPMDGCARLRIPKWRLALLALPLGLVGAGVLHFILQAVA